MSDRITNTEPCTANTPRLSPSLAPAAAVAALVNSFVLTGVAIAQDKAIDLDKLSVEGTQEKPLSSPKLTAPVADLPQTIINIPKEVYLEQGATSLTEVLRNTPGISFTANENSGVLGAGQFSMRGVDASNAIFVDGVSDTGSFERDIYNIEGVEVSKGPSGDNGRGISSGYINLVTKSPRLESFQNATLSYGADEYDSQERYRATLDVNRQIGNSPIKGTAFRVNALVQEGGVIGREWAESNKLAINPSVAFGVSTPTRVTLSFDYTQQRNIPDRGVPAALVPELSTTLAVPVRPERDTFYGYTTDYEDIDTYAFTAKVEHDFTSSLQLINQTTYRNNERIGFFPSPAAAITGTTVARAVPAITNDATTDTLSNLTTLRAQLETGSIKHDISTGLEFSTETTFTRLWANPTGTTVSPTSFDASNPNTIPNITYPAGFSGPVRTGYQDGETTTAALFAYDTITFTPEWLLTLGGRLEQYERSDIQRGSTVSDLSVDKNIHSYKTGLTYKPVPAGSIYIAYGLSMRPPGTSSILSTGATSADNPLVKPQEARNLELGVKWLFFKNRLLASLALFDTKEENVPVTNPDTGQRELAANRQTKGFELGLSGNITDEWTVFGGFAHQDAEYENPFLASNIRVVEVSANPRNTGNIWSTYNWKAYRLNFGAGAQFYGKSNRRQANSPTSVLVELPSYTVINASLGYEVSANFTLRLNVNNIADELYARGQNVGGGTGSQAVRTYLGDSRNYQLTAVIKF